MTESIVSSSKILDGKGGGLERDEKEKDNMIDACTGRQYRKRRKIKRENLIKLRNFTNIFHLMGIFLVHNRFMYLLYKTLLTSIYMVVKKNSGVNFL